MTDASFVDRIRGVAALDHPVTQSVYRLLAERGELSRDVTADALDLPRSVAAFHLDELAGSLLAEAVERSSNEGVPVDRALRRAAVETGRRIGEAARFAADRRAG